MKLLDLEFLNAANKTQHLKLKYVKEDLDEATVRQTMQKISAANLFSKEDVALYKEPIAARYVETVHTDIFDDDAK